jgi:hypothetical protein
MVLSDFKMDFVIFMATSECAIPQQASANHYDQNPMEKGQCEFINTGYVGRDVQCQQ